MLARRRGRPHRKSWFRCYSEACTEEEAATLLRPRLWKRLKTALDEAWGGCTRYPQDGQPAA